MNGNAESIVQDAVDLVHRASGTVLTNEARQRLVAAVLAHNDGRVKQFLTKAAAARDTARWLPGSYADARWELWAKLLHCALDESWPVDHPAYRRHERTPTT